MFTSMRLQQNNAEWPRELCACFGGLEKPKSETSQGKHQPWTKFTRTEIG